MQSNLQGKRILIVEDSPLIADDTGEMIRGFRAEVVGPAPNMAAALQLAQDETIDAAVVDVNIRGGKAFAVMTILEQRGVPFLLTSGYANWAMPEAWQDRPRLPKPYTEAGLREQLEQLLEGQG